MNRLFRLALKRSANALVELSGRTAVGRHLYRQVVENAMARTQSINHNGVALTFSVPNALCKYRADTFSSKEPETLMWLDGVAERSVLWDIGANVGLYSCYAARARHCRVFAFEPSVFNLELLARNVFLNGLTDQVTIVPLPLAESLIASKLLMTTTDWGGALSTFEQQYGHDGKPLQSVFELPTIGLSMVDAVERLNIPRPDYIKMDVDGIEHLILRGGAPILREVKSALIEINDAFTTQAREAKECLESAGMQLSAKRHADHFDSQASSARYTFNQIWTR